MSLKAELETWAAALKAYDEEQFEQALDLFQVCPPSPPARCRRASVLIGLLMPTANRRFIQSLDEHGSHLRHPR